VQLETSNATSSNYPTGRHSRYVANISQNGNWHRLAFSFLDRPDGGASNTISKIAILFNPNSFTGDTYYFDNFDSYNAGDSGANQPPTVSITSPANNSSFTEGASITITASASDPDGSVSQVQFFANGASIGIDNTAPYSVNWTVPLGTNTLTAVATDNQGASTTSSPVAVTGTSAGGGGATAIYISSVVTGTVNVGAGNKRGTAAVTILDNLNNPVSGVTVSGTFSGTFNESASGITNSNGQATMQTSGTAKGAVTVNFCVNTVSGPLPYDPSLNSGSFECTSSLSANGASHGPSMLLNQQSLRFYPNPVKDQLWIEATGFDGPLVIYVTDLMGRTIIRMEYADAPIDVAGLQSGLYLLEVTDGKTSLQRKFIK
jgi:hypothetical protein